MQRMLAAARAMLLKLQPILRSPPVLGRVVVVLLAHRAFERDYWSDVLGHTRLRYHECAMRRAALAQLARATVL